MACLPLNTSGAGYIDDFTTDLEIGSDNIVYAGFRNGRVFRATSTAGTAWTEITPPNTAPYNGTRVELALAPSTNGSGQVVYAIATFNNPSNYSRDIKWFSKSVNGGDAWTTGTELLYPYNNSPVHFTQGTGYYSLVLAVAPDDANTVYAGGYIRVLVSLHGRRSGLVVGLLHQWLRLPDRVQQQQNGFLG